MGNMIWAAKDGKMIKIGKPHGRVENFNFLITCNYGDWSGFGSLAECEMRIPELEEMMAEREDKKNFYYIVER